MIILPFFECVGRTCKCQHKPAAAEREVLSELLGADIVAAIDILSKVLGANVIASNGGTTTYKAVVFDLFRTVAITKHSSALLGDDRDGSHQSQNQTEQ